MKLFKNGVGRPSNKIIRKRRIFIIAVCIIVLVIIAGGAYLLSNVIKDDEVKKSVASNSEIKENYDDLINVEKLSEKFMNNYFEEISKIKEEDKKNMLIIISDKKPYETYGASKIIEAPNHQFMLQYDSDEEKKVALNSLRNDKKIKSVEENNIYTIEKAEYDSWGVEKMNLSSVLDTSNNITNANYLNDVVVAIIDTGCDINLFNKYYNGKINGTYNVLNGSEKDNIDSQGHGTHVAGIIAETTPSNVKILPIKTTYDGDIYMVDLFAAIDYAIYKNVDIINMSFGYYDYSVALQQKVNSATQQGIIIVAAAGNGNSSAAFYPASYKNVISVASVNSSLNKSSFSNYGNDITFTAPGTGIKSIMGKDTKISRENGNNSDDDHEIINGTSMAAAHISGAVAVIISYDKDLTLTGVTDTLKQNVIDLGSEGWDPYYGYGFVSLKSATTLIGDLNDDGNLDINDANILNNYLNKKENLNPVQILKADYDSNGNVTVSDYCAILKITNINEYNNSCSNNSYSEVKSYSGKDLYEFSHIINCSNKNNNDACTLNNSSDAYWNNINELNYFNKYSFNYFANIATKYKNTQSQVAFKMPDNLEEYDTLKVSYYVGTDKKNMGAKVTFTVYQSTGVENNKIVTEKVIPNTKSNSNLLSYSGKKVFVQNLDSIRERLNNGSNYLIIKINNDENIVGTSVVKIKSISLIKNKNTKTTTKTTTKKTITKKTTTKTTTKSSTTTKTTTAKTTSKVKSTTIIGDLDNDDRLTSDDANLLKKYLNRQINLSNEQLLKADYDSSNVVNSGDYCAILSNADMAEYNKHCLNYEYSKVRSYSGKELYNLFTALKCNNQSKNNACKYNSTASPYWNNSYSLDYFTNISASYENTETLVAFKMPENLSEYDYLRISYYVGSDKKNMKVKAGFWINSITATGYGGIKTDSIVPSTKSADGTMTYTSERSFTQDINSIKNHLNRMNNADYLVVKVYHDSTKANTAAVKIKSVTLIKKKVVTTTTTKVEQEPKLYCVANKSDSESKKISEVSVNKEIYCYTDNKAGILLEATRNGFDYNNNRTHEYTTIEGDYWIRVKYKTPGTKIITATEKNKKATEIINVIE